MPVPIVEAIEMTHTTAPPRIVALDAPTEESFDRITAIALRLLDVPAAMITLASEGRPYHRTRSGEESADDAADPDAPFGLCRHVIERGAPLVVHDLRGGSPDVPGHLDRPTDVRAYAGHPLIARDGAILGALCVFSPRPRGWTATDLASLESLARIAVAEIELRLALDHAAAQSEALRRADSDLQIVDRKVARYREIFANSQDATAIIGLDGRYVEQNEAHRLLTGYGEQELVGATPAIHLGDAAFAEIAAALRERGVYRGEVVSTDCHGMRRDIDLSAFVVTDADGAPVCYVGIKRDITERKRLEEKERVLIREQAARQEAEAGRERVATILESITDAFFALDAEARFVYVNRQMEVLLGRSRAELIGRSAWEELALAEGADLRQALERAHLENVAVGLETTLPQLRAWFQVHAYPSEGGVAAFLHDVTERRAAVDQLRREALHDSLTGLPNRIQFMQRLGRYVERNERRGEYGYAVLFLDLDRFKVINDSLGHVVGDELLVQIARRLEACLRPVDMVARFGGDEFAILLHDADDVDLAIQVAERIEIALHQAFSPAGYQVYTSASIGITLSSNSYLRREDVLRDADTAMYRAKASGVRYAVFDSTMHEHAVTRLHLESELRPALEQEQLRLFFQPIVDLRTARLAGFEALVRWFHPKRGILSPHEFVPLAEETGIIVPIGWWVLEEACRALVGWQEAVPGSRLRVNVNLSGRQLVQGDMVDRVDAMLATYDIPPESLSLEITESVLMKNPEQVTETLRQLKQRGVHLCIDDFGTGYSSFTYLHRFPVDTLKVDRTFVARLDNEAGSHEIVQAIIGLAHSLGLEAIAEGIEHPEQLAALQPLRPPYAQGFLFGRPLDSAAAMRMAREGRTFL